jgi:hypothetical protein
MQRTVHFITSFFNVVNVLLCVIYQLNFTMFMYVTRISRYIQRSVLSEVSRNRRRSWNVLPLNTGALLYLLIASMTLCVRHVLSRPRISLNVLYLSLAGRTMKENCFLMWTIQRVKTLN